MTVVSAEHATAAAMNASKKRFVMLVVSSLRGGGCASCAAAGSRRGCLECRFVLDAINEDHFHRWTFLQQLAAGDYEVGDFALLDAAQTIGNAIHLRNVDGHGLQRV